MVCTAPLLGAALIVMLVPTVYIGTQLIKKKRADKGDPEIRCWDACTGLEGKMLPSCLGCDWYLDCEDEPISLQCPAGEVFDAKERECMEPEDATCGLDKNQKKLGPSQSFSGRDVRAAKSSGLFRGIFNVLNGFWQGVLDGYRGTSQGGTEGGDGGQTGPAPLPPSSSATEGPGVTQGGGGGGFFQVIINVLKGIFKTIFPGNDNPGAQTGITPQTGTLPPNPTPQTPQTTPATPATPAGTTNPAGLCINSCQQTQWSAYSVHALCGRCSYFVECSYGSGFVRRCGPYTYFSPRVGRCVDDIGTCLEQGFMAEDPVNRQ